jgi:putative transcriptional regulator
MQLSVGHIISASATMDDAQFANASILFNQQSDEGIYGFVLNKPINKYLHQYFRECKNVLVKIYWGGPVGITEMSFIHNRSDLFAEAQLVADGIYWGGYFDKLIHHINDGNIKPHQYKIFLGYCGWDWAQIVDEIDVQNAWCFDEDVEVFG